MKYPIWPDVIVKPAERTHRNIKLIFGIYAVIFLLLMIPAAIINDAVMYGLLFVWGLILVYIIAEYRFQRRYLLFYVEFKEDSLQIIDVDGNVRNMVNYADINAAEIKRVNIQVGRGSREFQPSIWNEPFLFLFKDNAHRFQDIDWEYDYAKKKHIGLDFFFHDNCIVLPANEAVLTGIKKFTCIPAF